MMMMMIIINSHDLYGNTGHLLGTCSHHVLWNFTLFPQEVQGLLEECAQEESNYRYINCVKRVRAQTVKWNGSYNTHTHLYILMIYFSTESGDPAAACQGGNEGLRVPRPAGAAQGGSVSGAGRSPWEDSLPLGWLEGDSQTEAEVRNVLIGIWAGGVHLINLETL